MLRAPDRLKEFAAAIDDLGVVNEISCCVDHAEELQHPTHTVKTAERSDERTKDGKPDLSGSGSGSVDRHALTDLSLDETSVFLERQMARQIDVPAVDKARLVKSGWPGKRWQRKSKRIKCMLRRHEGGILSRFGKQESLEIFE